MDRRSLLAGLAGLPLAAVALPTVAASALASPAVDPDAGLLALIARHGEALAELKLLDEATDPLREQFRATVPERPDALRWRPDDFARTSYGRGLSEDDPDTGDRWYGPRGAEWLRTARPVERWTAEAEARRLEIIRAHDEWHAECRALTDRLGLRALNDACDRASDVVCEVEMAIMDAVPVTLAGFQAKARWIAATRQPEQWGVVLLWDLAGIERVTA